LPKATVEMSVLLEKQIIALETNHISITNKYFEEKKINAKEIIDKVWYPLFLEEFFKNTTVQEVWEEVSVTSDNEKKMETLKEIVQVIQEKYNVMMDSTLLPLEVSRIECITAIQKEYQKAKQMSRTISENISSVNDVQELRNQFIPVDMGNIEDIMYQYMQKADGILDKVQNAINIYEKNEDKINKIIGK
jgi:prophage DNA circulation protein